MVSKEFSVPEDGSVSELLDLGSRALLYFEHFEPRYQRAFGDLPLDYRALHARFYEQNGLDETKIQNTADAVKQALDGARGEHGQQQQLVQRLPGVWEGEAAIAASDMLATQLSMAAADITAVDKIWGALNAAPSQLRDAVRRKADVVLHILENGTELEIDGKTPGDIDVIISGAEGMGWEFGDDGGLARIKRIFPDLTYGTSVDGFIVGLLSPDDTMTPGGFTESAVQRTCQRWLDEVFKDDYPQKTNAFIRACDETDQTVSGIYGILIAAFGELSEAPYPCPQGVPQPPSAAPPSGSPGAPSTPGGPSSPGSSSSPSSPSAPGSPGAPAPGAPGETVPASTQPGQPPGATQDGLGVLGQLGSQLQPLATQAAQAGEQAFGGLPEAAEEQARGALGGMGLLPEDAAGETHGDGHPDDPASGEDEPGLNIGGKRLRLELGQDGTPHLVLTGEDGKPQHHSLQLDEQGRPVIVTEEPPTGEEPAPEDQGASEDSGDEQQQSAGQQANPGSSPGASAQDGEQQPQSAAQPEPEPETEQEPQPEPPAQLQSEAEPEAESETPPATGARLAEAGPL